MEKNAFFVVDNFKSNVGFRVTSKIKAALHSQAFTKSILERQQFRI
jgi:hypothetical protein